MAEDKVVTTPYEPVSTFGSNNIEDQEGVDTSIVKIPYNNVVSSMMYLASCTRPNLAMVVSTLSCYRQNP